MGNRLQKVVDAGTPDAGTDLQFAGRAASNRGTHDREAARFPRLAGGVERERLACAGSSRHNGDAFTSFSEAFDHRYLLG